jgi:uncharacterized membrane protein
MTDPFLIAFREAFQCSLLLALVFFFPSVSENRASSRGVALGVLAAFLAGFPLGYLPFLSKQFLANETWTFWRFIAETVLFYLGIVLLLYRPKVSASSARTWFFVLGFALFFFEARGLGFLVQDMGAMQDKRLPALLAGLAGLVLGFLPLVLSRKYLRKVPFDKAFILPSLLMTIGALQFAFGGVSELERENIMVPLQRGLLPLLEQAMRSFQSLLLVTEHAFLDVVGSELAKYLAGDRTALALTVVFVVTPPVFILIHLFSRPDPPLAEIQVPAHRRRKLAFFRNELLAQTTPVMIVFLVLVVLLHAVNISLNPLYDPAPVPVRDDTNANVLLIPLADKLGDFTDKKIRKYVYYHGNKQIIFLAVLKADGTVGVALDECEICRPADWNVDAKGYAQKGEHLICKYCMTPIATSTVNNPGGCNPIPIPFRMEDGGIAVALKDLIGLYQKVQELEKKGTHL